MGGIMAAVAAGGTNFTGASFTPAAGSYLVSDNGPGGFGATFTITATGPVVWYWSYTGNPPTSTVTSGGTASSIKFDLGQGFNNRTSYITVTSEGKTWSLTLSTTGDPTL